MPGKIFVNYRRDDSAPHALSIAQYLEREFGPANVFLDIDRMRAGEKFPKVLEERLAVSKAMLVVIGPQWLALKNDNGTRRLDDPEDWVRLEIARALARGIPVIPVLVGGASLPKKSDLPDDLRALIDHQVATVTTNGFRAEMACLARDINTLLGPRRRWPIAAGLISVIAGAVGFAMYAGLIPMMGLGSLHYPGTPETAEGYCNPAAYDGYQSLRADLDGDGRKEFVFAGAQMAFTHAAANTPSGYACDKRVASRIGDAPTSYEGFKAGLEDKTGDGKPDLVMTKGTESWVHSGRRDGTFAEGSARRVALADLAARPVQSAPPPNPAGKKLTIAEARRKVEEARAKREALLGKEPIDDAKNAKGSDLQGRSPASDASVETPPETSERSKSEADAKAAEEKRKAEAARQKVPDPSGQSPNPVPSGANVSPGGAGTDLKPGRVFRDCEVKDASGNFICPQMVVVPAGDFVMGSPETEEGRSNEEGPQHRVTLASPFAVGVLPVTRSEFENFVIETKRDVNGCWLFRNNKWMLDKNLSFRNPGFTQDESHPVVCVNWNDAKAYLVWLSGRTGKLYRLPTEAEREYVARAGTTTLFWWGNMISGAEAQFSKTGTAAANSFKPNAWGIYGVHGNVWEWVEDCWHVNYQNAPDNGGAWTTSCYEDRRVVRGGSWFDNPKWLRAAQRGRIDPGATISPADGRSWNLGFRVARTLE